MLRLHQERRDEDQPLDEEGHPDAEREDRQAAEVALPCEPAQAIPAPIVTQMITAIRDLRVGSAMLSPQPSWCGSRVSVRLYLGYPDLRFGILERDISIRP